MKTVDYFHYSRAFVTGVVRYQPEKCWRGLTLVPALFGRSHALGAALYDMNGNLLHTWEGLFGSFDNKLLPGGDIIGTTRYTAGYWLDCTNVVQKDWDGNVKWSFTRGEELADLENPGKKIMSARQHHDFQREGSPVGYYSPGQIPKNKGITLINSTRTRQLPEFSPHPVADTLIMEVNEAGDCLWQWSMFDHWDQMGISSQGKAVHSYYSPLYGDAQYVKTTYTNNINWVGPNKWYDAGDERFHPDNIIADIRLLNIAFIIDKKTGNIVWRLGPDFEGTNELQRIGQIVGLHHAHIIPAGLPGAGNVMLFDNGGQAGVGPGTPCAPTGFLNATRGFSRVLEINPVTLEVVWAFNDRTHNFNDETEKHAYTDLLYSAYCSSADRLPNGNTMITEFIKSRVIEVTPEGEIVWEFINPGQMVFRAHRYPYDWCPQVPKLNDDIPITPVANSQIRLNSKGEPSMVDFNPFYTKTVPTYSIKR